jgi:NADH-quinone oxidoreductase subunit B
MADVTHLETRTLGGGESGFVTTKFEALLAWARKYSLFQYPFATACCGMEFFSTASPRYDIARFGAEAPRFSPRQSDVLWVVGTISQRQAPVLRRVYEQMTEPKWVIAFGTCASCGGFYDNYATVPGIDKIIPVDVFIPGCPPRPEAVLDGLMLLQDKIGRDDRTPVSAANTALPPGAAEALEKLYQIRMKP